MRRPLAALPTALMLALLPACAERAEAPAPEADATPVTAGDSPTPAPGSATAGASPSAALALVPARFHGIWDAADAPCDPATDMRVEIAERGITFYESHGAVTALSAPVPDRITVELAMQGEGEKWTTTRTFTLNADGTRLTPSGGGDTGPPMPLKRCA